MLALRLVLRLTYGKYKCKNFQELRVIIILRSLDLERLKYKDKKEKGLISPIPLIEINKYCISMNTGF